MPKTSKTQEGPSQQPPRLRVRFIKRASHHYQLVTVKTVTGVGVSTESQSAATKTQCATIVGRKGTLLEPVVSRKDKGTGPARTQ